MNIVEELKKVIQGDVVADEEALEKYSRDASLFVIRPEVVTFPKDSADVEALVRFVNEHKDEEPSLSLTARSAGTDMSGGPLTESIVAVFPKYFNHVRVYANERKAIAEPGVYYRDFEAETIKDELIMPTFPASRELCAMGGIINNNSAGEKTLEYGQSKDYIESLKVVLADGKTHTLEPLDSEQLDRKKQQDDFEGEVYRKMHALITENKELIERSKPKTSKNSAGYLLWEVLDEEKRTFDLSKVIVGAQGTLGIVTEATFKLVSTRPHSQMLVLFLDDIDQLGDLVNTVLEAKPSTFESYDDKTLKLAVRFFWDFIKRIGFFNILKLGMRSLPEMRDVLKNGFPKLVLQVTFDGEDQGVLLRKAVELQEQLKQYNPRHMKVVSPSEAEQYWRIRRESFALLRNKVKDKKTAPFIDDIIVTPAKLPEFLPKLDAILEPYADRITYTMAGHIGNGNFHIIPLMNLEKEEQRQIIPELADKVYALVIEYDGSITAEHNDGLIRSPYLKDMYGDEMYRLFEEVKRIFDPKNIFNPGKKVNSDAQYAYEHIRKE